MEGLKFRIKSAECLLLCVLAFAGNIHAQMTFDFAPDGPGYMFSGDGGAPFLQQNVIYQPSFLPFPQIINVPEIVEIDGVSYYHLVVGDPATDFVQEVYIQRGFTIYSNDQPGSASFGVMRNDPDPLGPNGGSGTGNPNRIMLKQVVKDTDITMSFTKDTLSYKPIIAQTLHTSNIQGFTEINMSNSTYSEASLAGEMANTLVLQGQLAAPGSQGDFDMDEDLQHSTVTAGRYIYTTGSGLGGSAGSYDYIEGGFDRIGVDWKSFVEDRNDNVWSWTVNHPFP